MEIIEVDPFEEKPTIKDQYLKAGGKEITKDYFVFNCFEELRVCLSCDQKVLAKKRWPRFTDKEKLESARQAYKESLWELCEWYGSNYPELASERALDYGVCGEILHPFALLVMDIVDVFEDRLSHSFVATCVGAEQKRDEFAEGVWCELQRAFKQYFPAYDNMMIAFLQWQYAETTKKEYDLGSLPPVGRFLPMLMRHLEKRKSQLSKRWRGEGFVPSGKAPTGRFSKTTAGGGERSSSREKRSSSFNKTKPPRKQDPGRKREIEQNDESWL